MAKSRILIVDDEEGILEVCADILRRLPDTEIILERQSRRAAERLSSESLDLLIADIRMPGIDGVELLRIARQHDPNLTVLMLTAFPTVETAVESMKLGAADYITKPFIPNDLLNTVRRLLEGKRLREEKHLLQRQVERAYSFGEIIGKSPAMQAVFETIRRVAETDADVLIVGETGTGKELVARSIHRQSQRQKGPFVPVDCGAIPENLLESEFFGYERGAFTGAHTRSLGLLEFANQGTFFLDEVTELPLRLQTKLLRVLQERKIRRVGGKQEIEIDIRIVAATNRDPAGEMRERRLREDLYYRINVARIDLPPLRERREDIPLLAEHFVREYAQKMGKNGIEIDPETLDLLMRYPWPGNVRELQNVLKRVLAMSSRPVLSLDDLPDEVVIQASDPAVVDRGGFFRLREQRMAAFEKEYLASLLRSCLGDVSQAAREAQLPRGTLYRLLKKYELDPKDFRP
ncbi:MAG: sigma-54-dependent Fis family transcriptional regulator [Candidatus Tectomicrobia bacterium]|uniref:Sigma-54-dependent Fis family transcriptional regulator n=1 Tax=Tectimicrobiota bacterium TaxID=2528274 RepID=A0A932FX45_UNCTE|nr:sigma-54-dependent Fis family transcriptional regulator [Candidatus Tectomicrobia bacterium]